ncbi:MAG: hypothetical protein JF609_10425 [Verrucomicrobia bacterium]|nr:hypothetical protein [Verrucomicrobiota bacterium]
MATALTSAFLLSGCRTDKEDIVFSDEATAPHLETNTPAFLSPKDSSLAKADETQIELLVFRNLLTRHFWDDGDYTAIFLRADDSEVAALQKSFPDRKPPIKEGYRADLQPNQSPRDKDTGRPAMILSVDVGDPEPDGSVTAIGKWYAGGAVTGFYSFPLKKNGQNWEVQNP